MKNLYFILCILFFNWGVGTLPAISQNPAPGTCNKFNGIWCFKSDMNATFLKNCVSHQIFNIFVNVGYPKPSQYPTLVGIVPANESGINVTKVQVDNYNKLLASVDSRLKLWAWFGTWNTDGKTDAEGHALAKVDVSTVANRTAIIDAIVDVAGWGFYGIQDDTEDFTENSKNSNGQFGDHVVNFWNDETVAMHKLGLKIAIFTPAVWHNFNTLYLPKMKGMDYIIAAGLTASSSETSFYTQMRQFLKNTKIPVTIDIQSDYHGASEKLINWINGLPLSSYSNIVGYSLYDYRNFQSHTDWAAWDQWTAKDSNPPAAPTITQDGLLLSSSAPAGNIWRWNDMVIPGATAQKYTATKNGTYTVVIKENGCTSLPSLPANITTVGIDELTDNCSISVYPNPFQASFRLKIVDQVRLKNAFLKIYSDGGQEIKTISIHNHDTIVERGEMKNGTYVFSIINDNENIGNGKLIAE